MKEPPEEVVEAARVVERWFNENLPSEDGEVPHWALGGVCSRRYEGDAGTLRLRLEMRDEEIRKKNDLIYVLRGEIQTLQGVGVSRSVNLDVMRQRIERLEKAVDALASIIGPPGKDTWATDEEVGKAWDGWTAAREAKPTVGERMTAAYCFERDLALAERANGGAR